MNPLRVEPFIDELLTVYSTSAHSLKTFYRLSQVCRELQALRRLDGRPLVETTVDLNTATMAAYVVALSATKRSPNTILGHLDYARIACSYAIEQGYLDRQPAWRRIRPRPRKMVLNRPVSYPDLCRLLAHLKAQATDWRGWRLYALTATVALTGVRRDEALRARVEDLDLAGRRLELVEREVALKTPESEGFAPVPDDLVPVLEAWLPQLDGCVWLFPGVTKVGPWTGGEHGKRALDELQAAARAAGIPRITWHSLRHSYATSALLVHRKPLWVVQRVLRHTDPRTTERYLHLDDAAILVEECRSIGYRTA